jgi:hypothetical protein
MNINSLYHFQISCQVVFDNTAKRKAIVKGKEKKKEFLLFFIIMSILMHIR